jgi:hypothetical protein
MRFLRCLAVFLALCLGAVPCVAQRDPEKQIQPGFQPNMGAPAQEAPEKPTYVFQTFVALLAVLLVLLLICMPSRKGI